MFSQDFTNANNGNGQSMDEGSVQPFIQTPLIPQEVYDNFPELLKDLVSYYEPGSRKRDVFTTAAIPAIGSSLFGIRGIYQERTHFPTLCSFTIASPGSDKGVMGDAVHLIQPLHDFLAEQQRPIRLIIPANNSASALMNRLVENDGHGFMPAQEADTFSNAKSQKWGAQMSDMLRSMFHHETLRQDRITSGEATVREPKVSIAFTGTPNQLKGIISNGIGNGEFSRFMYYMFEQNGRWRRESNNREIDAEQIMKVKGQRIINLHTFFKEHPCTIKLTATQKEQLDNYFDPLMESFGITYGEEQKATIKRLAVMMFRICLILTAIRKEEEDITDAITYCSDVDFNSALMLIKTYKQHAETIIKLFPPTEDFTTEGRFQRVLNELPEEFSKQEALAKAIIHNLSERTLYRRIEPLRFAHGMYKKR